MRKIQTVLISFVLLVFFYPTAAFANAPLVLLDPGHGGVDGGAGRGHRLEKNINLDMGIRTREWLEKYGYSVKMTRESDVDLSNRYPSTIESRHRRDLQNRLNVLREVQPALLISLHVNSSTNAADKGPIIFYATSSEPSKAFAHIVQEEVNRVAVSTQRPVGRKNLFLIRHSPCPAVLVEFGFVTNHVDAKRLMDSAYRDRMAHALADAVKRQLPTQSSQSEAATCT